MSDLTDCLVYSRTSIQTMDASALLLNPKRQKLDGGEELDGGSKSLSNLPDVIILKVLSLLPTKDAIRTSILS